MKAHDPVRWTHPAADAPREIAAEIRALRAEHGSSVQIASLGQRLARELATPTLAGTAALGLSVWMKWLLGGLLSCALGFVTVAYVIGSQSSERRTQAPAAAAAAPSPRPALPSAAARPALEPRAPAPASAARLRRGGRHPAPAAPAAPERELTLLQSSQAELDRDPAAALALAERHARDYPRGVFAQEREILAIEALLKLKRQQPALARAETFIRSYPDSPHARRVRALLERSRSPAVATTSRPSGDSIETVKP